jgi:3-hydroxyisobutyrate dehydrogenase-like beta-hydroxyacid dehydrogenase
LIIDCSTISPNVSIELNQKAKTLGLNFVDAPVTGAIVAA